MYVEAKRSGGAIKKECNIGSLGATVWKGDVFSSKVMCIELVILWVYKSRHQKPQ